MRIWAWPLRAAAVTALIGASACADTGTRTVAQAGTEAQRACFRNADVTSWAAPDRETVNLRVNQHDYYQIKLIAPCSDIDFSQRIGLKSGGGSDFICNALDAQIVARMPGGGSQTCPAKSLHKLTDDEVKALGKNKP